MTNKKIRCFDNGGITIDRYTIVFMNDKNDDGTYNGLSCSLSPSSPDGFCQHTDVVLDVWDNKHLGKEIDVPEQFKSLIEEYE